MTKDDGALIFKWLEILDRDGEFRLHEVYERETGTNVQSTPKPREYTKIETYLESHGLIEQIATGKHDSRQRITPTGKELLKAGSYENYYKKLEDFNRRLDQDEELWRKATISQIHLNDTTAGIYNFQKRFTYITVVIAIISLLGSIVSVVIAYLDYIKN